MQKNRLYSKYFCRWGTSREVHLDRRLKILLPKQQYEIDRYKLKVVPDSQSGPLESRQNVISTMSTFPLFLRPAEPHTSKKWSNKLHHHAAATGAPRYK